MVQGCLAGRTGRASASLAGLKRGDRPVLLLAGVLLLMLGQWVVVAALLTLEALATVAGVLLLGIALQARPRACMHGHAHGERVCSPALCRACVAPEI